MLTAPALPVSGFPPALSVFPDASMQPVEHWNDPLEVVRQRRRFDTDEPATWDPMTGVDHGEVLLFSSNPPAPAAEVECANVLTETFKSCFGPETPSSVSKLVECIADSSNYKVLSITRLQNLARYSMHKLFGRGYGISSARQVYHGTTKTSASTIAKVGFRNAVSQRALFGKGIYAAANVWEALAYAEPEAHSNVQTFLVADLLQGPTRVGHENMVDFGRDLSNKQILTTTNPQETIFCAAYEDQLYAHYRITVRFLAERRLLPSARKIVGGWYHPAVWSLIKAQAAAGAAVAAAAPVFGVFVVGLHTGFLTAVELPSHKSFKTGDTVKVVRTLKPFSFCHGAVGRIAKIVKDGHVHFCVEFDSPDLQDRTKLANKKQIYKWHTDLAWLCCRDSHIETVTAPAPGAQDAPAAADSSSQSGLKRKRD